MNSTCGLRTRKRLRGLRRKRERDDADGGDDDDDDDVGKIIFLSLFVLQERILPVD